MRKASTWWITLPGGYARDQGHSSTRHHKTHPFTLGFSCICKCVRRRESRHRSIEIAEVDFAGEAPGHEFARHEGSRHAAIAVSKGMNLSDQECDVGGTLKRCVQRFDSAPTLGKRGRTAVPVVATSTPLNQQFVPAQYSPPWK